MEKRDRTYACQDLVHNKISWYDVSRLKIWKTSTQTMDPSEAALRDNEEFVIEEIIDHRGNQKWKKKMRILHQMERLRRVRKFMGTIRKRSQRKSIRCLCTQSWAQHLGHNFYW